MFEDTEDLDYRDLTRDRRIVGGLVLLLCGSLFTASTVFLFVYDYGWIKWPGVGVSGATMMSSSFWFGAAYGHRANEHQVYVPVVEHLGDDYFEEDESHLRTTCPDPQFVELGKEIDRNTFDF